MKWRTIAKNTGIQTSSSWQGANRYLMITLSYRFGLHNPEERKLKEENNRLGEEGKS